MRANFACKSIILFFIMGTGCSKFVEVGPPKHLVVTDNVYSRNDSATAVLLGIYAKMGIGNTSPYRIAFLSGLGGDELTGYAKAQMLQVYTNAIDPATNDYCNSFWDAAYTIIYIANAAYEGCSQSTALDPDVRKQLMAEALFIRAYWYFYLVNFYGDVPLALTTDYKKNQVLSRTPTDKVYDQIIADLTTAQSNLNASYVGQNSISPNNERLRPNKATAAALLARVYLYRGDYTQAEALATTLINASGIYALVEPDQVFLKNSKEVIWQLMPTTSNGTSFNTPEGSGFILNTRPDLEEKSAISPQLMNSFEEGDLRKANWIARYRDETVLPYKDYYYPFKYKVKSGEEQTECSVLFRLAEQYLIRAECRAHLGKLSEAIEDLDVIRKRAGLPLLANTHQDIGQEDLLNAILKERQNELFTEQAHRWFDLKRTGTVDSIMRTVTNAKGGSWKKEMQRWPLPASEIVIDPNLKQNEGYN
ncbi:Starch-binding associating with outer membrane [Chitinophaga sp. CF118]|uniref:RagB/SusD family nutrient uptake outer membrane protein n=1 Tax=Chitinophaga sp. CF118 TaxID=1884367 RepID=UPI0008DEC6D6|nr:RagB/SusD family nutrient uptake outer membrane protein [Chitinophaga sp. CF118]SFF08342.1 Starch-binding associating with outer membrane [Chitinophaga sp. CF118]